MTDNLDQRTYDLYFGVRRSVRYHRAMQRFFGWQVGISVAMMVLCGLAALAPGVTVLTALLIAGAAMQGFSAGKGSSMRADHDRFAALFKALEVRFAHGQSLSDEEYTSIVASRLLLECMEPPVMSLLDVMCHYQLLKSLGDESQHPRIPLWRRLGAYMFAQTRYVQSLGSEVS